MKNLVSMGGQHQGVFGFPGCPGENFQLCDIMRHLLNLGAYLEPIQSTLIQAQVSLIETADLLHASLNKC
jgi:palmitoyl-protein thioesterase